MKKKPPAFDHVWQSEETSYPMLRDADNQEDRAATYEASARRLRRLAAEIRFDLCRREQLCTLADAFDRLADRLPLKHAAD